MFSELEKVLPTLEALIKELKALNENEELKKLNVNLFDLKKIMCDIFGWRIVDDKEE